MPRMHAPTALSRALTFAVATTAVTLPTLVAHAQDAVQWRVEDGGNGHWYEVVESGEISFDAARAAARGMGGDLGVVDSDAANEWVVAELLSSPERWLRQHGPWIGLFQDRSAPDYVEPDGGWYWVNGDPLDYADWAPGEGCEDMPAELRCSGEPGCDFATYYALDEFDVPVTTWGSNVADGDTWQTSYLVEWSADCNGDGIVDYGQILDGTLADEDDNGVPDCCDDTTCLAPVQWRTEDGGNGHWYQLLVLDEFTYEPGLFSSPRGAHAATLVNSDESDWVFEHVASNTSGWTNIDGALVGPRIGLGNPCDGAWYWLTGEPFSWSNWAAGEPSSGCDGVVLYAPAAESGPQSTWAMFESVSPDGFRAIVLEWSADCNGDGLVDYGQIASGELADTDDSGIPDICEAPVQWETAAGGNGHWYQYNTTIHQQRDDARTDALAVGGDLVSITSPEEDAFVDQVIDTLRLSHSFDLFTGGYNAGGSWAWTTGEAWTFTDWHGTQGNAPYVEIVGRVSAPSQYQRWGTAEDGGNMTSMIEWSADCNGDGIVDYGQILDGTFEDGDQNGVPDCCDADLPCASQWKVKDGGNGHWYRFDPDHEPWASARTNARSFGADLSCITGAPENDFVRSLIPVGDAGYLGGIRQMNTTDPDEGWSWISGEDWDFTDWNPGEPNGTSMGEVVWLEHGGNESNNGWNDHEQASFLVGAIWEWSADCNGDGIVDYGQILDGTFSDDDGNGVPDACEQPGGFDGILDVPSEYATIQEAVDACPEGGTIRVAAGTYHGSGDSVITLPARRIDITGEGASTIIDGLAVRRGLSGVGSASNGTVVDGLTFTNCHAGGGSDANGTGGGLYLDGVDATVRNCAFIANTANLHGGGMCVFDGTVSVESCTFTDNSTLAGGQNGGGLYFDGHEDSVAVSECSFMGNQATSCGGAFGVWEGSVNLADCTLFENNSGEEGGGLWFKGGGDIVIDSCVLTENSCGQNGGGVAFEAGCHATIEGCRFEGNTANVHGGGAFSSATSRFDSCVFAGNSAVRGGAACSSNGTSEFIGNDFSTNQASEEGGALYMVEGSAMSVQECTFTENSAPGAGSSILSQGHDHDDIIVECVFLRNEGSSGNGGIMLRSSSPSIEDCLFIENSAGYGSGITSDFAGNAIIRRCRFVANTATTEYGAGIWSYQSSPQIIDCDFLSNTNASGESGAGVRTFRGNVSIGGSRFCNNDPSAIDGPYSDLGGNNFSTDCPVEDCNDDGILDFIQIFDGTFADCDGNGVPDPCDLAETLAAVEPRFSNGPADPLTFDVSALSNAESPVEVSISTRAGDVNGPAGFVFVYLDEATLENRVAVPFGSTNGDCATDATETFTIPAARWNEAGSDGVRTIIVTGNGLPPNCGSDSFTAIDVTVDIAFEDCNINGVWDACEIADGTLPDADADGVIDDCDGCPNDPAKTDPGVCGCGTPDTGDADDDGLLDCIDPCPTWPYDCSEEGQRLLVAVGQPIQLAIDVAPEGGVVQLAAGTHQPTDTILVGSSIELVGTTDGDGNPTSEIEGSMITGRAFDVVLTEANTLTASDLIIRNCNVGATEGAAMRLSGGTAILLNTRFEDNTAAGDGGALSAEQSVALQLIDCVFTGNQAEDGGAIFQHTGSTLSISGGRFEGNGAVIDTGGSSDFNSGGAIAQSSSSGGLDITNCDFLHNRTEHDDGGGGAISFQAELTIENCTFTGNSTEDAGGALFTENAPRFTILDSVFTENRGGDFEAGSGNGNGNVGGAICVKASTIGIIEDCDFIRNFAAAGGVAYLRDGAETHWTNCLLDENSAYWASGALDINGSVDGPGSVTTFNDCVITRSSKQASNTGASTLWSGSNCQTTFNDCEITGNLGSGPILRFPGTPGLFQNTIVCDNEGTDISGDFTDLGGNCITEFCDSDEDGVLECDDACPGEDDLLDTDKDGTPDCLDPCPTWPYDCSEDGQTVLVAVGQSIQQAIDAVPDDGVVQLADGVFPIESTLDLGGRPMTIRGAAAGEPAQQTVLDGAGLRRIVQCLGEEGPDTRFEFLLFTGGYASGSAPDDRGGAMYLEGASPTILDCIFTDNDTTNDGGAIAAYAGSSPTVRGCLFIDNDAAYGGAVACSESSDVAFDDCVFEGNTASIEGGAVYAEVDSEPTFLDCLVRDNQAGQGGGLYGMGTTNFGITTSVICGNTPNQVDGAFADLGGNCILDDCGDDLDENGVPDACDPDCDGDDIPDDYEISTGTQLDCDFDGTPDDCAIEDGLVDDCNANGIPDSCDIADGTVIDSDIDGRPDVCEIARGDLNLDDCVNAADLGLLIALWGLTDPPLGDLDGDGIVSAGDLGLLISYWTPCDP